MDIYEARSGKPLPKQMEAEIRKALDAMEEEFGKLGEVVFSEDFIENRSRDPDKMYKLLVQKTGEKVLRAGEAGRIKTKDGKTVLTNRKPGKNVTRYQGGLQAPHNDLIVLAFEHAVKNGVIFHETFHGVDTKTGITNFSNDAKYVDFIKKMKDAMKKEYEDENGNASESSRAYYESDHEIIARLAQQYMLQKLNPEHVMGEDFQGHWEPKFITENAVEIKGWLKDIVEKAKDAKVRNFAVALLVGMGLAETFGVSGDGGQEA